MRFTVLGAGGFVGGHLVRHLTSLGHEVLAPEREATIGAGVSAGHVIYAIGLTGDFRTRMHETVEAHVGALALQLQMLSFDSWLYLSSTRVYGGLMRAEIGSETVPLRVTPGADAIYDLSKLLGEAICLAQPSPTVRVVRLSNVFGAGQSEATFLGSLLADARTTDKVTVNEDPQSSKDYVSVDDCVPLLVRVALEGSERLYNVAGGTAVTHATLAQAIHAATGAEVNFTPGAPLRQFPHIDISRIRTEFGFGSSSVLDYIAALGGCRSSGECGVLRS